MTDKKRSRLSPTKSLPFEIVLPATSANLGPAFDAGALALNLFLKVGARIADRSSVTASGRDADVCGRVENHLILETYRDVVRGERKSEQPLSLQIDNEIPIGKGCGSSAAARLAGIALAVHFGKLKWSGDRIISEASRREHHADNAAACWLGGLTVARTSADGQAKAVRIVVKGKWPLILAIPEQSLSTEKARLVLPARYSRADVVTNIQNSLFLLAAFSQGRPELLADALDDRMHQPYRAALCPLLPPLQNLPAAMGVLGVALSGAGPSVLIFVNPKASVNGVVNKLRTHLRDARLSAELLPTQITANRGKQSAP